MKNKKRISKIIFILSFLPYIVLILISLYYAIFGHDVYAFLGGYIRTDYGMTAFLDTLIWNVLSLCFIPVLPVIATYQIIFIIIHLIRYIKNKKKKTK